MYKNLFNCRGKVAVVTGGAGLIGREAVKALSDFGARVYVADIDKKNSQRLLRDPDIKYIYMDTNSESSVKKAFLDINKTEGKIDILVNCAYPASKDWGAKFERVSLKSWKEAVDKHLGGCFLCCQTAARIMKKQRRGSIVNFGSIYGISAPDFRIYEGTDMTMPAAYSAIKGGITAFTKYLAAYYAEYNIRVNIISPGGVYSGQRAPFVKNYQKRTPMGRMASPSDIAGAAVYLASDASSYVTGQNLIVDGGWTIW